MKIKSILASTIALITLALMTVTSFASDEPDYNDSVDLATEIETDTENEGTISFYGDTDWYTFENTEDYFIFNFIVDENTDISDIKEGWDLTIYDHTASNVLKEYENIKTSFNTPILPYVDTIYVKVTSANYYEFPLDCKYKVKADAYTNDAWENEYNDSLSSANKIKAGKDYFGAINKYGDVDCFKFTTEKEYFTVSFSVNENNKLAASEIGDGWTVTIYHDGEILKSYSYMTESFTSPKLPYKGNIYISVSPAYNYSAPTNCIYKVKAETCSDEVWEDEDNNKDYIATVLKNNVACQGVFNDSVDIDWYVFNAGSSHTKLTFVHNRKNTYSTNINDGWKMTVYNKDGVSVAEYKLTDARLSYSTDVFPETGKYYISISPDYMYSVPVDCYYSIKAEKVGHTSQDIITKATLTKSGKVEKKCSQCGISLGSASIAYPKTITLEKTSYLCTGKAITPKVTVKDSKGNVISSKYYSVKYYGNNIAGKASAVVKFTGKYSGSKTLYFTITPKQVTGLKTTTITKNTIKLAWNKVAGAKIYQIEKSTDGKKWTKIDTTTSASYTVSELTANRKYQFRVTALDSTKKIAGKTSSVLKTGTLTYAPTVKLTSAKSKTVTASWQKITGASKYAVYKSMDGKKWTKETSVTGNTYTFTQLAKGKTIYVKVAAVNTYGEATSIVKNVKVK